MSRHALLRTMRAGEAARNTPRSPLVRELAPVPGGRALDPATRAVMQRGFDHDFSRVRLHTDVRAAQSAAALGARAYTVGSNVVFAAGAFAPASRAGQVLLAHELAHVVQNERHGPAARRVSTPGDAAEREARGAAQQIVNGEPARVGAPPGGVVQRLTEGEQTGLGVGLGIAAAVGLGFGIAAAAGAFDREDFSDDELQEYLRKLDQDREPVGGTAGDNKARAVVKRWKEGAAGFTVLTVPIRVLLIKEMSAGYLSAGDQQGILDLLRESIPVERAHILPEIGIETLKTRFDGERRKSLDRLLEDQDTESLSFGAEWTVPETKKIVSRHGDGGIIKRVLDLGFKFFRFETAFDKWKYLADGRVEENELTGLEGNTDRKVIPKRIRLRKSLTNEQAALVLYHESDHAVSAPATSQAEGLEGEIHARVEAERFGYRHGMAPYQPGYRTARGDPDEAKIRTDVTGSSHYNPQNRKRIGRRYVGEQETSGWEP